MLVGSAAMRSVVRVRVVATATHLLGVVPGPVPDDCLQLHAV